MRFWMILHVALVAHILAGVATAQPLPRMPGLAFKRLEYQENKVEYRAIVESTLPFQPVPVRLTATIRSETPYLGGYGGRPMFSRSTRLGVDGEEASVRDRLIRSVPIQWIRFRNDAQTPIDPPDPEAFDMLPRLVRPGEIFIHDFAACIDYNILGPLRKPGTYRIEFPTSPSLRPASHWVDVVVREPKGDDAEVYRALTTNKFPGFILSDPWLTVSRENVAVLQSLIERFPRTAYADDLRFLAARSVILSDRPFADDIEKAEPDTDGSRARALGLLARIDLRRYPFAGESLIVARHGHLLDRNAGKAEQAEKTLLELFPFGDATRGLLYHLVDRHWLSRLYASRINDARARIRDKDPMIRFWSIRSVNFVDVEQMRPLLPDLDEALDDDDPRVRLMAAIVLVRKNLQDDKLSRDAAAVLHRDGVLQTDANAPEAYLRRNAIEHLSLCGSFAERSIPALLPMLDQPGGLRTDVVRTLMELGRNAAAAGPKLKELADDPKIQQDAALHQLVNRALRNMGQR